MTIKTTKQLTRDEALELINSVDRPVTIATLQETFSALGILMAREGSIVNVHPDKIIMGNYIVQGKLYSPLKQFLWTH